VHRPISGVWAGIPFHIGFGVSHQLAFDQSSPTDVPGSHEPPTYTLVTVADGAIVMHHNAFTYDGPVFSLMNPDNVTATRV
jgi:hypothetical protein